MLLDQKNGARLVPDDKLECFVLMHFLEKQNGPAFVLVPVVSPKADGFPFIQWALVVCSMLIYGSLITAII